MPKVNYQLGKMYKIFWKKNDKVCYVGSTCQPYLCNRWQQHKNKYKTIKDFTKCSKFYKFIHSKGGFDNFQICLLEMYPCLCSAELLAREGYWQKTENATLNSNQNNDYTTSLIWMADCCICGGNFKICDIDEHAKSDIHINSLPNQSQFKIETLDTIDTLNDEQNEMRSRMERLDELEELIK